MRTAPIPFLSLVCLLHINVTAQDTRNLVLEGAGIRGVAYVGAIKCLEENGKIINIEKVAGTSAGAIAALAISLGYTSVEIEDLIYNTKLQKFNDGSFLFIGGLTRLNRNYGWYRGKAFTRWLETIIEKKTGNKDITFKELHDRKFRDLFVTGTSLNQQRLIVFSHESYPAMKVKDAVRISMSIPMYFEAVFIDSAGNVLRKKSARPHHNLVVDGGFTGNFPITIFDSTSIENGVTKRFANRQTLGIRIDTPEQIRYDSLGNGLAPIPVKRFRHYIAAFYSYVIENLNRVPLTQQDWERTVSVSSGDIGPRIRKLPPEEKDLLITNGYDAMKKFLARQHDDLRR